MLQPAEYPDVSVSDVPRLLQTPGVVLVDVRESDEWEHGHAAAATHLALSAFDLAAVPDADTVLCICRSGGRSRKAADALLAAGRAAHNVAGGMLAWQDASMPIVRADGTPGQV